MSKSTVSSFLPAGLLLLIASVLTFAPGLLGSFIFDDLPNLVSAEGWKASSLSAEALSRALQSDISGTVGRPFSMASFAINHAFTGMSPFWLKLTNLLWHGLNGVLVWRLCRQLLTLHPQGTLTSAWPALILALIWLLHPLQISTVLYVVQRMEIAAATGILLSLLAYVAARRRELAGERAWPWLLLSIAMMLVGLGFKETALLVPLFALLLECCLFRFRSSGGGMSRRWVGFWAVVVVIGLVFYLCMIIPRLQAWPYVSRGWGPGERLLTQLPVLVMYLKQILLPWPNGFHFYYDNFPVARGLDSHVIVSVLILISLIAMAWMARRRWPLTTLGVGWFFIAHALTSNLWPLELAFEHRNYLALLGVLLAMVQPVEAVLRRLNTDARAAMIMAPLVLLAVLTHIEARTWGDPMRLAWTLENRNPNSPRASYALGQQMVEAAEGNHQSPLWTMALGQFEHAAKLPGDPVLPLQALIMLPSQAGIPVEPEIWERFRVGLLQGGMRPEHAGALYALVQCRIQQRCALDDGELLHTFLALLERMPSNASLLTIYANFSWNVLADKDLAIAVQRDAVQAAPGNPAYRVALAKFLLAKGDIASVDEGRKVLAQLRQQNRGGLLDADLMVLERLLAQAVQHPQGKSGNDVQPRPD